jgi:hypothetical protein
MRKDDPKMSHRLSRHALVALAATVACAGGLGASVVASAQTTSEPTSAYTVDTVTLGEYTTTAPSAPSVPATVTAQAPARTTGGSPTPTVTVPSAETPSSGPPPSRTTRDAPKHLAFTGAEPLIVGAAGLALMLAGFALHRRRRTVPPPA